jgi:hypothetical protein
VVCRLWPLFLLLASPVDSAAQGLTGCRRRRPTCDPPHKQLLVRLGVGGASSVAIAPVAGIPRQFHSSGAATGVAGIGAQGRTSDMALRGGLSLVV